VKLFSNTKGITTPVVLILLLVAIIFGSTSLFIISTEAKMNNVDEISKKALEYAEAGYNAYLWHLNDDVNFYSINPKSNFLDENAKRLLQEEKIKFHDGYYQVKAIKPSDTDRFVTIISTGWTERNPEIKRTIKAKVRKKQFVHHVYVSDSDGNNIWWTTGDESHGPYHTNNDLYIQKSPIFFDTISYSGKLIKGTGYNPDFKVKKPTQPQKLDKLEFPKNNKDLEQWAEKDNMVFAGRTCIYLDGEYVKIRNGNVRREEIKRIPMSEIGNKVIYVKNKDGWRDEKFDLNAGNIFISGKLKGKLTIGAENNIYITYDDPTNWYEKEDRENKNPPISYPNDKNQIYGVTYYNTKFNAGKSEDTLSYEDKDKGIWTRDAVGKDMLGLVANKDIMILHYGWPRYMEGRETWYNRPYWNYKWDYVRYWDWGWKYRWEKVTFEYDVAPYNITIHAALFAIQGGFGYENYDAHDGYDYWGYSIYTRKGDIILWGNITQKERKPVGLIGLTGYNKKYAHDPRMFYDYPPHILEPTNVGWEVHDWKETNGDL
jgi:hypothetical protein